ncbi:hypothetical protein HMPREF1639_03135 [Peptostreptococcus sp. MV1]|uniref:hypothetical protein n=1 Tax=Peptostreptococcus sp. MV1 TaxID=1219626 RepID=UPI00050F6DC3|nr:hypothetical protein [Peptostreptococcus sp. MV1]KGF13748.1 hypothetical protein HMPREF1639_03135 [Peptostreptococcus sp. MV1]
MTNLFNNEKVLVSFETKRRLSLEKQGTNMVANCLLGHSKTSGVEPDLYTIYLTDKTFFAEFSRKSLHGDTPKKVTKLDIPLTDVKKIEFREKDGQECLYLFSAWAKEYYFEIENEEARQAAEKIIAYIKNK